MSDRPTIMQAYRALLAEGSLRHDEMQELAAEKFDMLNRRLGSYQPQRGKSLFGKLFAREGLDAPEGLYVYGGVGRGKSMLMDLFFDTTDFAPKRRVHFHAFMAEIHDAVHDWRQASKAERRKQGFEGDDPIPPLAEKVARDALLLCFDEFQVTDVADAMILGRLFEALFANGVVIVATSNRAPNTLYEGGLNRNLFLPFIDMIQHRLDVLHLASPTDYRMQRILGQPTWHVPLGPTAAQELEDSFAALTDGAEGAAESLEIKGRTLQVTRAHRGVCWFSFEELCARPLGARDYLALAERYHTMILSDIPQMSREQRNEAKRFVTLIDTLYEARVRLICSADARPEELYPEGDGAFEFQRTVSRLIEMQSEDYFQRSAQVDW